MPVASDKYGIPPGGNNGPWVIKRWKNINLTLTWNELMAAIALGGWPQELWATAGAVAAAESSRQPFIYNTYKKGHFGLFQISRSAHADFFAPNGDGMKWVAPWTNAQEGYAIYKSQGWGAWQAKTSGTYLAYMAQATAAATSLKNRLNARSNLGGALGNNPTAVSDKDWLAQQFTPKTSQTLLNAMGVSPADIAGAANSGLGGAIAGGAEAVAQGTVDSGTAVASSVADMTKVLTGLWESLTTPAFWMRVGYGTLGVVLVAGGLMLIVRNQPAVKSATNAALSVVPGGGAVKAVKGGKAA